VHDFIKPVANKERNPMNHQRGMVALAGVYLFLICHARRKSADHYCSGGSGSNLPTPLYSHWIEEYNKLSAAFRSVISAPHVKGIRRYSRGVGDFAAGEVPMSDEQLRKRNLPSCTFPTVLVAIVPIYHVPGVKGNLLFSGPSSQISSSETSRPGSPRN